MIFLRPWFLLLILLPIVFRIFRERFDTSSSWAKVIDEKLLPYLLIKGTNSTAKKRSIYKTIIWMFLCIALAGPAWDKEAVPTQTSDPGTVIVLEISQILSGENLVRAQQKIYDVLDYLDGEQVALVLYDRFGYTAGPLTFETDIIRQMVPSLDLSVLPEPHAINPEVGFEQANRILENAGIKQGRILFLTTGVGWPEDFISSAEQYNHEIGVLGIGTETPYPIPLATGGFLLDENNQPVMVSLNKKKMSKLGVYHAMTADDTDIKYILENTNAKSAEKHESGQNVNLWKDMGGYFVLATLPFFALLFRKGILMGLLMFYAVSAHAGLWRRPDQEAFDKQMLGVKNYQQARYEQASRIFKTGKNADDMYNYGNSLAFQQKIEEAIQAYKQALLQNPKHEDARYNKEYLEKKIEEEKQRQEEERQKQEQEKKQQEQQEQLNKLQELLQQEKDLKQQEIQELQKQSPEEQQEMSDLLEKLSQEYGQKQNQQEQVSNLSPKDAEKLQQELKKIEEQLYEEIQQKQEQLEQLQNNEELQALSEQFMKENELKRQELKSIQKMRPQKENLDKQQQKNNTEEKEVEQNESKQFKQQQEVEPQQQMEQQENDTSVFDQKSQEILNHLEQDPDSILRYRIRQQYLRRVGA